MTHDFTNKAILCQTWQQMLHLAGLAREQYFNVHRTLFNEEDFNAGSVYFEVAGSTVSNVRTPTGTIIPYTTFINPPVDDSVYGC